MKSKYSTYNVHMRLPASFQIKIINNFTSPVNKSHIQSTRIRMRENKTLRFMSFDKMTSIYSACQ